MVFKEIYFSLKSTLFIVSTRIYDLKLQSIKLKIKLQLKVLLIYGKTSFRRAKNLSFSSCNDS